MKLYDSVTLLIYIAQTVFILISYVIFLLSHINSFVQFVCEIRFKNSSRSKNNKAAVIHKCHSSRVELKASVKLFIHL